MSVCELELLIGDQFKSKDLTIIKNEGYFDGGSRGLDADIKLPGECRCKDVIVGRINPDECPMFSKGCRPDAPWGPCMVSGEGACGIWYRNRKA